MNKSKKILIGGGVALYLVVTGFSWAVFGYFNQEPMVIAPTDRDGQNVTEALGPKDQECPINGAYFTKTERDIWQARRPLTVTIENHLDSRPQSGLSRADVVYEAVAEGGITRFLGVFYCGAALPDEQKYDIGPVRSARTYFLDWVSEYGDYPLYTHVGGAGECGDPTVHEEAKALCQIRQYGWMNEGTWSDFNQFSLSYNECRRDTRLGANVATEHTVYCDTVALWDKAAQRGLAAKTSVSGDDWDKNFRSWLFKEEAKLVDRGEVNQIGVYFWKNQPSYDVIWQYDKEGNNYQRINGGSPHKDFVADEALLAKVVIIQLTRERGPVGDKKHLLYDTLGEGQLFVFQDGQVEKGTWEKDFRESRTRFFDNSGAEIRLNRGLIWVQIVPAGNTIEF
ncbi:MAG: DUF3048 domain-containing protein [Candidatus Shapirobacteria bacterium]|nr:DUF3048 domain-containing protein [Candidatus Shapirobacteria bacterium]MDD5073984.1 DUF3048 domain-containing protein [Candidatus Shapirobacteria bacterium]MDD5481607.1 DUF3048 domain-containing protein [Candidatus Shapirobacteria bacterium]